MKKSFLHVPVALLILFLVGCSNEPSSPIVGTWQLENDEAKMVLFRDDGSLVTTDDGVRGSGSWNMPVDGNLNLEITTSGSSMTFSCNVEIIDDFMVLTSEEGEVEKYVRAD